MTNEEVAALVKDAINAQEVIVKSEGTHYQVIAIDDMFDSISRVKRQQMIYAPLSEKISDGTIHAVSIKTFSTAQWQREKLFN
ncbi:BolA family transcriptional regulator [Glaciecola sp. XM2]|jgi:acid stress-induced BolA-like protein IbaG/YrbA|uniref:BolA family protein n=1 Tax=Glaciecola sp. XM2 TaxID=1914931 RepID=UPI001BDE91FC|nr:BolA family protein [Glaciecola sp. XM2]MBT1452474.1 BolA family transcriptional regulator [Glaciecola sp. XM2]